MTPGWLRVENVLSLSDDVSVVLDHAAYLTDGQQAAWEAYLARRQRIAEKG